MAERKASKPKTSRWQRIAMMDKEILDVEGAATLLGSWEACKPSYRALCARVGYPFKAGQLGVGQVR